MLSEDTCYGTKRYPIYVERINMSIPQCVTDVEILNMRYSNPSKIDSTADKLRWYRYKYSLLQKDVADKIGVDLSVYKRYESPNHEHYPRKQMDKLSELYGVPVEALFDEYNLFLYNDQGKQIRSIRQNLGMSRNVYAKKIGVQPRSLKRWEQNSTRVLKSIWERCFK